MLNETICFMFGFLSCLRCLGDGFHQKETIRAASLAVFVASAYKTLVPCEKDCLPPVNLVRLPAVHVASYQFMRRGPGVT